MIVECHVCNCRQSLIVNGRTPFLLEYTRVYTYIFFIPFVILALLSPSLPVPTQIRGHIAGPPPPSPLRYVPSFLSREECSMFLPSSTRVELYVQNKKKRKYIPGIIYIITRIEYTPAVRSKISVSPKLIFASCVCYSDRAYITGRVSSFRV